MNRKEFMEFGKSLTNLIATNFSGSNIFKDVQVIPGWSIFYLVEIENNFNCQFREWAGNPFYFVVEKGNRKLAQLDLTKILKENGKFTWYLSKPTNKESLKIYDALFEFISETPIDYRDKVKEQKILLKSNPTVFKSGYLFVEDASQDQFEEQFINFIRNIYEYSKNPLNWKGKKPDSQKPQNANANIFNLEDIEAEEGYKEDKVYLYTHRNRDIVQKRKELDNYTCQICGFNFALEGKHIIECHHLNPLSESDIRITNINDLISVCPTCHRIIHLRKPPFTPEEVKSLLNK
ncbi:HNH endonuclease [Ignavibacterium album]|uniref:HNH endonuclease n=1 Tax=Ignavibacterium album TaxID=591197 RepID=UPI0026EEFF6C|nr:HNH endonuclease [Ignavibacterium album]